jgi:hypothetical protein
LDHPNVLPFLGATIKSHSLSLVSPWMESGNINRYIRNHPEANRLQLVRSFNARSITKDLTKLISFPMWQVALNTSTLWKSYMQILKG